MPDKTKGLDLTGFTKLLSEDLHELAWTGDYNACKGLSKIIATAFQDHTIGIEPEITPAPITRFYFSTSSPVSYLIHAKWTEMLEQTNKYRREEKVPVSEDWQRKDVLWYPLDTIELGNGKWITFYYMVNNAVGESFFYIMKEGGIGVSKTPIKVPLPNLKAMLRNLDDALQSGTGKKHLFSFYDVIDNIWTMANLTLLEKTLPVPDTIKKAVAS